MRLAAALIAIASALIVVGCGSSDGGGEGAATTPDAAAPPGSLEALWRASGTPIGATPGTSDHGRGANRASFLVVDKQGRLVERSVADVWIATGLKAKPYAKTVARLVTIGVPGGEEADMQHIYVTAVETPRQGKYWYLAVPRGSGVRALGNILVRKEAKAPEVGDPAIASRTPTLRSTGGDLELLSTSRRPNRALYESSVHEALAANAPFVVTFSTPQFCQTRLCGPVVDVVGAVQKRFAATGVRFIHAEIYRGNDPAKGVNRWVTEWGLPTEPWTFVVDRAGRVTARFENAMSAGELTVAVRGVAS